MVSEGTGETEALGERVCAEREVSPLVASVLSNWNEKLNPAVTERLSVISSIKLPGDDVPLIVIDPVVTGVSFVPLRVVYMVAVIAGQVGAQELYENPTETP